MNRKILSKEPVLTDRERKNLVILETIRGMGPISKTDISRLTQFNIVTVSNYITQYIKQGLVLERGLDISSGGRRPVLIELNANYGYVIGLDLGRHNPPPYQIKMVGVLTDLAGNIIAKLQRSRSKERMGEILEHSIDMVRDLIRKAGIPINQIRGIGVGVSGAIDITTGSVRCPLFGDSGNFETVISELEKEFDIPVYIGNDASFAAYGEYMFYNASKIQNMLFVYSDVGCGIIMKGQMYCGATGCAGEVTMNPPRSLDPSKELCGAAENCLLKTHLIDWAIGEWARTQLSEDSSKESKIREIVSGKIEEITFDDVVRAAEEGDAFAIELLRKGGEILGMKVAYLINFLNPDLVVIGGGTEQAGAFMLDPIRKVVARWAIPEAADLVKIVNSRLAEDAVAMGASGLVIRELFTSM